MVHDERERGHRGRNVQHAGDVETNADNGVSDGGLED